MWEKVTFLQRAHKYQETPYETFWLQRAESSNKLSASQNRIIYFIIIGLLSSLRMLGHVYRQSFFMGFSKARSWILIAGTSIAYVLKWEIYFLVLWQGKTVWNYILLAFFNLLDALIQTSQCNSIRIKTRLHAGRIRTRCFNPITRKVLFLNTQRPYRL